jgi:hypothetical protein
MLLPHLRAGQLVKGVPGAKSSNLHCTTPSPSRILIRANTGEVHLLCVYKKIAKSCRLRSRIFVASVQLFFALKGKLPIFAAPRAVSDGAARLGVRCRLPR